MAKKIRDTTSNIQTFEYTSGFHLLTMPRETLSGSEDRKIRIARSNISYTDGVKTGNPVPAYEFEVSLEDFARGLGGTINKLEKLIDDKAQEYLDSQASTPV
jgi:hypothetical protein